MQVLYGPAAVNGKRSSYVTEKQLEPVFWEDDERAVLLFVESMSQKTCLKRNTLKPRGYGKGEKNMKNNKKKVALLACLFVAVVAIFGAIYFITRPTGSEGSKNFTLEVVLADGSSTEHKVSTDAEYLGEALLSEGLIDGSTSEYGLYVTTVNGVEADSANQEWWCLTINGEMSMYGVDQVPVTDGEHYEFTLTVGW